MDDQDRLDRLERRLSHLEARLLRLERGLSRAAELEGERPLPPPPVSMTARPPQLPSAPVAARPLPPGGIPGWQAGPPVPPAPTGAPGVVARPAGAAPRPAEPVARWTPTAATHRQPAMSLKDLEERFAGRAMAWVGGLALVAAAVFFLSLAFSRGWINEEMRVLIGLAVGTAAFLAGGWFLSRANALMGNVLTAVGLGIFSIALYAATRAYALVDPEVGLFGALVAAIAAAAIAIRFDAREVAVFGLIAALAAPPVVGAPANLLTLGFVAVTLVGTTTIALFRSWRWLPPIAFVLAAPQLASWLLGDPDPAQALVALGGFWLVNIVASAGEEARVRRDDLRPSSATLVLANATFLGWGGFQILGGDLETWRGTFTGVASLAHLLVGGWFLRRQGLEHLFGNLVGGTGVALLAIAAFVQLGAPAVPLAWAAEAAALAWLAVRRRHRWSAMAAVVIGALATGHLLALEYPLHDVGVPAAWTAAVPFQHPETGSIAGVLLALAVTIVVVPVRWLRSLLAAVGMLLAAHAVTFEVTGPALAAGLMVIALGGLLLDRFVARLGVDDELEHGLRWTTFAWSASTASVVAGAMAILLLFSTEYPPQRLGVLFEPPVQHPETLSLVIVLGGLAAIGVLAGVRWIRSGLAGIGVLLVGWAMAFEATAMTLVAGLALLLPLAVIADRGLARLRDDPRFAGLGEMVPGVLLATVAGALAWGAGLVVGLDRYLDPTQWGRVTPPALPFSDDRALVGGLLVASALAAARWVAGRDLRLSGVIAAIMVAAVVVPFEVYADWVVVLWVVLAATSILVARWAPHARDILTGQAGLLGGGAAVVAWAIVAAPDRLWVVDPAVTDRTPLLGGWPLAFIAISAGLYLAPRHAPLVTWRTWFELASGATLVYLASVGVVSLFQGMTGGETRVEELAKQAQVALSVTWTTIGAGALVVALSRHRPMLRHAGFGLLGLATAKVFTIDLAAMDVAYRALVLAGLGLLLLASAWLFTHFRGPSSGASGITGGARPAG